MKKILMLLALFYSLTFGQGWNSTVTITSINEPNLEKMDLFTNASGNHILIKRTNGNIVYYNVNSSGTVDADKTATLETSGDFPNIVGSGDIVYALYKAGSEIHMKYSSNGGTSWTYSSLLDINIGSNACNGIDAVYEKDYGVHLVWATQDNGSYFETYYFRLTTGLSWVENKNVTDHTSAQVGGQPSVSYSSGRVHVSFNTTTDYNGDVLSRDRISGSWQTPASAVSGSEKSAYERLIVRGSTQYLFYSRSYPPYNDLRYRTRSVTGGSWSGYTVRAIGINNNKNSIRLTKTANDNIHLISDGGVYNGQGYDLAYSFYNGSTWSTPEDIGDGGYIDLSLSSVSNDLFVTQSITADGYLRYKQNDQNPLTPANFAGSVHYVPLDLEYKYLLIKLRTKKDLNKIPKEPIKSMTRSRDNLYSD